MQLVLDTNGLIVKKRNESFYIISKKIRRTISPYRVDSILVTADCLLSTAAIKLAVKHDIPIIFVNRAGTPQARMWQAYGGKEAALRRRQYEFSESVEATQQVVQWFLWKGKRQVKVLEKLREFREVEGMTLEVIPSSVERMEALLKKMRRFENQPLAAVRPSILGTEGSIARFYWQALSAALPKEWQFKKRSRRPAEDAFNALLNYGYGMLYTVIESAIFNAGLDPQLGVFHRDEWNKPTLSFDLIEPFRPWVDELLVRYCLEHPLDLTLFEVQEWRLNKKGRLMVIHLFNQWILEPERREEKSRKDAIYTLVGQFAQSLKS